MKQRFIIIWVWAALTGLLCAQSPTNGSLVVNKATGAIVPPGTPGTFTLQNFKDNNGLAGGSGLPSQGGNTGKFLKTDGSVATWGALSGDGSAITALNPMQLTGSTIVGRSLLELTNPAAKTYLEIESDNSVTTQNAATHLAALGGASLTLGNAFSATGNDFTKGLLIDTDNTGNSLTIDGSGNVAIGNTGTFVISGQSAVTINAPLVVLGPVVLPSYTVATLPSTAGAGKVTGAQAIVTDALSPTYNGTLTGGSSTVTTVFYNGTAWVSH